MEKDQLIDALARAALPVLGVSRRGLPIGGRWIAGDAGEGRLLVVAGIHGDEPASVEAVLDLPVLLGATTAEGDPNLLIVPALNPDGLALGRKNSSTDVDLNRNFPASNFARTHTPGYDPGPFPLSEPESALLARIVDEYEIDAVVAVHAPFACVNYDGPAQGWAARVSSACGWPVRENIGYPTPGSLGSWLGVDRGLAILTLELPPGPLAGFRAQAAAALGAAIAARGNHPDPLFGQPQSDD